MPDRRPGRLGRRPLSEPRLVLEDYLEGGHAVLPSPPEDAATFSMLPPGYGDTLGCSAIAGAEHLLASLPEIDSEPPVNLEEMRAALERMYREAT